MSNEFLFKPAGVDSKAWDSGLVRWGHSQKVIFHHRGLAEFFYTTAADLKARNMWEYSVREGDECVGSILAVIENDQHVGLCMSVQWALTKKPGVLVDGYRKLYKLAKKLGIPFICYTKEIAPYTYTMRYKKVIKDD